MDLQLNARRLRGVETNQAAFDKLIKSLLAKLDVYDKILGKQKYLAGDVSYEFISLALRMRRAEHFLY